MSSVYSADQWDRPVYTVNFTPQFLNITDAINNLQGQINNETQWRILNDSYLQGQISNQSINISQLFNLTNIYGINISYLYSLTNNLSSDISSINGDINNIYNNLDIIYNNISSLYNITVVLNNGIISVNQTLTNLTTIFNSTVNIFNTSIQDLYNISYMINSSIKQPFGQYLSYNQSNFWINESLLNDTINNISKNREVLYISSINITNGTGLFVSSNIEYLITKIEIDGQTNFKSECIEFTNGNMIDKNRQTHHYIWYIEKNYAINDNVNCSIINGDNGQYNLTITYLTNGL
jgi:hypothetical protein